MRTTGYRERVRYRGMIWERWLTVTAATPCCRIQWQSWVYSDTCLSTPAAATTAPVCADRRSWGWVCNKLQHQKQEMKEEIGDKAERWRHRPLEAVICWLEHSLVWGLSSLALCVCLEVRVRAGLSVCSRQRIWHFDITTQSEVSHVAKCHCSSDWMLCWSSKFLCLCEESLKSALLFVVIFRMRVKFCMF